MIKGIYKDVLEQIHNEEKSLGLKTDNVIDESYHMIAYLQNLLKELKLYVLKNGFVNVREEINFFKKVKPQILGKLVYYNKVCRIETTCPMNTGKIYTTYYLSQMKKLKKEFKEHIFNSEFYRYYRSKRTEKDNIYFRLGHINFYDGLNSFVFEIDPAFSTYYDYKIARIMANELLYSYLNLKIYQDIPKETLSSGIVIEDKDVRWTDSKSALIELVYALHVTGSISNGRIGVKKLSLVLQELFNIELGDIHHTFYRMKDRSRERAAFLTYLKNSLEQYMDKEI